MDYEKKYNEALERARAGKPMDEVFPELRESEGERMRKRAIAILKQQRDYWSYDGPMDKFPPATPRKDLVDAIDVALSYLERHKEPFIIHDTGFSKMGKMPEYCLDVKPAEWSEEDEKYLKLAINIVASDFGEDSPTVSWLKSLRPQPHWKPSKEQMYVLNRAISELESKEHIAENYAPLKKLRDQLEKIL